MRVKQREALCTPFLLPPPAAKEKKGSIWGYPTPRQGTSPPGPPLSAHAYGQSLVLACLFSIPTNKGGYVVFSRSSPRPCLTSNACMIESRVRKLALAICLAFNQVSSKHFSYTVRVRRC